MSDLDKEIHKLAYEINVFLSKRQPIKEKPKEK